MSGIEAGREPAQNRVSRLDAIVFAGGRGHRLGGRDKATLKLAGARLIDRVVNAARASGVNRIVVVGPTHVIPADCIGAREDPPFGGPLAALVAGLRAFDERTEPGVLEFENPGNVGEVLLLSCDLVQPAAVVELLAAAVRDHKAGNGPPAEEPPDAHVLSDPDGRFQWLAGRYRLPALRDGVEALGGDVAGRPLRAALSGLRIRQVPAPARAVADIDTPEDLARAIAAEEIDLRRPEPL